jgi:hypothetical protein
VNGNAAENIHGPRYFTSLFELVIGGGGDKRTRIYYRRGCREQINDLFSAIRIITTALYGILTQVLHAMN